MRSVLFVGPVQNMSADFHQATWKPNKAGSHLSARGVDLIGTAEPKQGQNQHFVMCWTDDKSLKL